MADTIQFDLVSPERKLLSKQVTMVELPGMDGDLAAMPNHSSTLTTLRPGIVRVHADGGVEEFVVTGGFAEISPEATSILAESATPKGDFDGASIDAMVEEAQAMAAAATEDPLAATAAAQRASDLGTLKGLLA